MDTTTMAAAALSSEDIAAMAALEAELDAEMQEADKRPAELQESGAEGGEEPEAEEEEKKDDGTEPPAKRQKRAGARASAVADPYANVVAATGVFSDKDDEGQIAVTMTVRHPVTGATSTKKCKLKADPEEMPLQAPWIVYHLQPQRPPPPDDAPEDYDPNFDYRASILRVVRIESTLHTFRGAKPEQFRRTLLDALPPPVRAKADVAAYAAAKITVAAYSAPLSDMGSLWSLPCENAALHLAPVWGPALRHPDYYAVTSTVPRALLDDLQCRTDKDFQRLLDTMQTAALRNQYAFEMRAPRRLLPLRKLQRSGLPLHEPVEDAEIEAQERLIALWPLREDRGLLTYAQHLAAEPLLARYCHPVGEQREQPQPVALPASLRMDLCRYTFLTEAGRSRFAVVPGNFGDLLTAAIALVREGGQAVRMTDARIFVPSPAAEHHVRERMPIAVARLVLGESVGDTRFENYTLQLQDESAAGPWGAAAGSGQQQRERTRPPLVVLIGDLHLYPRDAAHLLLRRVGFDMAEYKDMRVLVGGCACGARDTLFDFFLEMCPREFVREPRFCSRSAAAVADALVAARAAITGCARLGSPTQSPLLELQKVADGGLLRALRAAYADHCKSCVVLCEAPKQCEELLAAWQQEDAATVSVARPGDVVMLADGTQATLSKVFRRRSSSRMEEAPLLQLLDPRTPYTHAVRYAHMGSGDPPHVGLDGRQRGGGMIRRPAMAAKTRQRFVPCATVIVAARPGAEPPSDMLLQAAAHLARERIVVLAEGAWVEAPRLGLYQATTFAADNPFRFFGWSLPAFEGDDEDAILDS